MKNVNGEQTVNTNSSEPTITPSIAPGHGENYEPTSSRKIPCALIVKIEAAPLPPKSPTTRYHGGKGRTLNWWSQIFGRCACRATIGEPPKRAEIQQVLQMVQLPKTIRREVKWRCPQCDALNLSKVEFEVQTYREGSELHLSFTVSNEQHFDCPSCSFEAET